jgi:hypothetical protein
MQFKVLLMVMVIATALLLLIDFNQGRANKAYAEEFKKFEEVPPSVWDKVSEMKILFGHQSVGFNIIDGINDIIAENSNIKLNIVETRNVSQYSKGVFAHFRVGENLKPKLKIEDFKNSVLSDENKDLDIAFLKLCYVDIDGKTDAASLFEMYQATVEELKKQVKIIHFTGPLTTSQITWKTKIKAILGKEDIWEFADNITRNEYNEILLNRYQATDPIVNIAEIESTYDNGKRESFNAKGKIHYALIKEYTYDKGHLNEIGRKKVAQALLLSLANIAVAK